MTSRSVSGGRLILTCHSSFCGILWWCMKTMTGIRGVEREAPRVFAGDSFLWRAKSIKMWTLFSPLASRQDPTLSRGVRLLKVGMRLEEAWNGLGKGWMFSLSSVPKFTHPWAWKLWEMKWRLSMMDFFFFPLKSESCAQKNDSRVTLVLNINI